MNIYSPSFPIYYFRYWQQGIVHLLSPPNHCQRQRGGGIFRKVPFLNLKENKKWTNLGGQRRLPLERDIFNPPSLFPFPLQILNCVLKASRELISLLFFAGVLNAGRGDMWKCEVSSSSSSSPSGWAWWEIGHGYLSVISEEEEEAKKTKELNLRLFEKEVWIPNLGG